MSHTESIHISTVSSQQSKGCNELSPVSAVVRSQGRRSRCRTRPRRPASRARAVSGWVERRFSALHVVLALPRRRSKVTNRSIALLLPLDEPESLLVDRPPGTDGDNLHDAARSLPVDDPELADAIAAEPCQLLAQRLADGRILDDGVEAATDLAFELGVKVADE